MAQYPLILSMEASGKLLYSSAWHSRVLKEIRQMSVLRNDESALISDCMRSYCGTGASLEHYGLFCEKSDTLQYCKGLISFNY